MGYNILFYFTGYFTVFSWRQNVFVNKDSIFYNKNAHKERFTHAYQSIAWPIFIIPMSIDIFTTFEKKMNKYME